MYFVSLRFVWLGYGRSHFVLVSADEVSKECIKSNCQIAEEQYASQQPERGDVVARTGEPCAVAELITPLGQGFAVAFAELVDAVTHAQPPKDAGKEVAHIMNP